MYGMYVEMYVCEKKKIYRNIQDIHVQKDINCVHRLFNKLTGLTDNTVNFL